MRKINKSLLVLMISCNSIFKNHFASQEHRKKAEMRANKKVLDKRE